MIEEVEVEKATIEIWERNKNEPLLIEDKTDVDCERKRSVGGGAVKQCRILTWLMSHGPGQKE
jgi:hypothetical protein